MEDSRKHGWRTRRLFRWATEQGFGRAFDKSHLSPARGQRVPNVPKSLWQNNPIALAVVVYPESLDYRSRPRPTLSQRHARATPVLGLSAPNKPPYHKQPAAVPLSGEKSERQSRQKVVTVTLAQEEGQSTRPRHPPAQSPSRRARPPLETLRQDGPGKATHQWQRHRRQAHSEWRCRSRSSAAQDSYHSSASKHRGC